MWGKRIWTSVVVAAAMCLSTLLGTASAASSAPTRVNKYWGNVEIAHTLWRRVPFLSVDGTSYFGVWYLTKLLQQYGIAANWTGGNINISGLPTYNARSTVSMNGSTVSGARTLTINGSKYVDLTVFAGRMNWNLSYAPKSELLNIVPNKQPSVTNASTGLKNLARDTAAAKSKSKVSNPTVSTSWAPLGTWRTVPIVRDGNTNYFGIWYLMQYLKQYGYTASWHNGTLNLNGMPRVFIDAQLGYQGIAEPSELISYLGHWYAPLTNLMSLTGLVAGVDQRGNVHFSSALPSKLGGQPGTTSQSFTVTGQLTDSSGNTLANAAGDEVALLRQDGTTTVVSTDIHGAFKASVAGSSATLIGVYSPTGGWFGKATTVNSSNSSLDVTLSQNQSHVTGQIGVSGHGLSVAKQTVVLRNDLTHTRYQTTTDAGGEFSVQLPVGLYEIWTVAVSGTPVFLGQKFLVKSGQTPVGPISIPTPPTSGVYQTQHAVITAQNQDVSPLELVSVGNMFERIYGYDTSSLGLASQTPVTIQVFETNSEYTQHFLDEAYSVTDSQSFGADSQAASEGPQSIVVNMSGLTPEWGVDVMAHEFTHCLIATVSQNIPSWVNEGLAWHQGIGAEIGISPSSLLSSSLEWNEWEDIVNHAHIGDLYALGAASSLDPLYNVEAQDYYAVSQLLNQFGMTKLVSYIRHIDAQGNKTAFQNAFGESQTTLNTQVNQTLAKLASQTDNGLSVTLRVFPGGASKLFVVNAKGKTWWFDNVPSGTYTFKLNPDGSISWPSGLTPSTPEMNSGDGTWDVGAEQGGTQALFSISNTFALGYLVGTTIFWPGQNTGEEDISTGLPIGVQLVSITPNS